MRIRLKREDLGISGKQEGYTRKGSNLILMPRVPLPI